MRLFTLITITLLLILSVPALGEWPTDLESSVDFPGMRYGRFLADGRGGAWVAGEDWFGNLFVTRITHEGDLLTGTDWIIIGGLHDGQFSSGMFMSEDSCLILAYCQYDYIEGQVNLKGYAYLQKIDLECNKLWPEGGILVSTEQSSIAFGLINAIPELCTDQQGGVYVSWLDYRWNAIFPAIFSQHVWSDGMVDWQAGGKCILDYIDEEYVYIFATPDTQFVTGGWFNARDEYYYFMVNALGDTLFRIGNLPNHTGYILGIDDEQNIYFWDGYSSNDVRVYKESVDGNALWGENGVLLVRASLRGIGMSKFIDDSGGFFFSWAHNNGTYFQWIGPYGTPYFDTEQQVSTNGRRSRFVQTDSNHVMFIQNIVNGNTMRVYSQRISNTGVWEWPNSTVVHVQPNQSDYALGPDNISDGNGGEIIFFQYAFLKAKQVSRDGVIGDITLPVLPWKKPFIPESINCTVYPNPTNNQVIFKLETAPVGALTLSIYNLRGQLVMEQMIVNNGETANITLSDTRFTSGTYIARISDSESQVTHARFTLIK